MRFPLRLRPVRNPVPCAPGSAATRSDSHNVNADLAYTTFTGGKIVIATDDAGSARAVLGRPCNMLQQGLVSTACCQEDRTCDPLQSMHRPGVLNLAWTERLSGLLRGVRSRAAGADLNSQAWFGAGLGSGKQAAGRPHRMRHP
jgi:hypothetical protein